MKKLALTALLCLFPALSLAQTPTPTPTPKPNDDDVVVITTNLIQLDITVTDKNGRTVTNLTADDFEVFENNERQQITNFSFVSTAQPETTGTPTNNAPKNTGAAPVPPVRLRPEQVRRTIALLVDDLGLSFESVHYVRRTLKKFVDEQMQPNDLVAVIRTGSGIGALQQFTSDKRQLYAAIERIRWNMNGRAGISAFAPIEQTFEERMAQARGGSGGQNEHGDEALQKRNSSLIGDENRAREEVFTVGTLGAVNFVVRGMGDLPGRKAVMLFSDGFKLFNRTSDGDSDQNVRILTALQRLTDLANRASVVIYTMDARGLQTLGLTAADNVNDLNFEQITQRLSDRRNELFDTQEGLNYLAQATGGLAIRNTNDLSGGIEKMLNDQKGYYLIAYQPDDATFDPKTRRYNKLIVKVKNSNLRVRYRSGFFGISDTEAAARPAEPAGRAKLYTALTSPFATGEIEVRLISLFANEAKQGSVMRSLIHVKGGDLQFVEEKDGWSKVTFDLLAVTFGDNGTVVDQVNRTENIRARAEALEDIKKNGFVYNVLVPVKKPGAYQMRVALRDATTSRVGSANQFIEVPNIKKNRLTLSGIVLDNFEVSNKNEIKNDLDFQTDTARRRFRTGTALQFAFVVYNARLDAASAKPNLQMQFKLFRDGKEIFTSRENAVETNGQSDLTRIQANGALQLADKMEAGEYVLQIVVKDLSAKEKRAVATQWIDFEVVQ